jgi:hypothetical protein
MSLMADVRRTMGGDHPVARIFERVFEPTLFEYGDRRDAAVCP